MGGKTPTDETSPLHGVASDDNKPLAHFFSRRVSFQSLHVAPQPEEPPELPPHRRRPTLSALSGLLSFLLLLSICGLFGVIWGARQLHAPGPLQADKILYIAPGTDFPDIVATLNSEGVIDNPLIFNLAVMASGKRSKIKAGEYLFKQQASMHDVIDILVSGRQVLHPITIPEGLTSEQIVERLRANDLLLGDIREIPKEGSLLPETYKVPRGMARSEVIRRMQEDEKKLVEQIWAHRAKDLILRSPYELVTLASIVEKETGKPEERPHVAAVFLNRLQKKMRLQSDPTIVYGLVGGKGTLGRPILRSEVERSTPYNTYVIPGLPPGPITNAGRAALEAVANPLHSSDLYFVADGTGGHVFSATLEQHARNVQHWREIQKEAKEKASGGDVDHFAPPQPVTTGRSNQHSELDEKAVFGDLPQSLDADAGTTPSLDFTSGARVLAKLALALPPRLMTAPPTFGQAAQSVAREAPAKFNLSPGIDQLGLTIRGVPDGRQAAALLDGPVDATDVTAPAVPPPATVAAAEPGSGPPMTTDPGGAAQANANTSAAHADNHADIGGADLSFDQQATTAQPASVAAAPDHQVSLAQQMTAPRHPVAFDASEGTALDPLRNKTYDLNYAKTVPTDTMVQ